MMYIYIHTYTYKYMYANAHVEWILKSKPLSRNSRHIIWRTGEA